MPVARRRYDITPAEMLDVARTAVDAVVAELKERAAELVPEQVGRLEELSSSLAKAVHEVADASYRSQMDSVRSGLDAMRDDISAGLADHDARLVKLVEDRLSGYDPTELGRRLPGAVASAVLDGLDLSLPTIDKGIHEIHELVGELVERGKQSDLSRRNSLDRLDEVLLDLRTGLTENVTRQHAVLLEVVEQKLSELRLTELANELPARIGGVISESVQKSHDLQSESLQDLAAGLSRALDAGLKRQRSATTELSASAERMAESVSGFSAVAEEAVSAAFERSQAAQGQRLSTMVRELREAQAEAAVELVAAAEGALAGKLEASYDALGAQLRMAAAAAEKIQHAQGSAFAGSVADLRSALGEAVEELRGAQAAHAVSLATELERDLGVRVDALTAPQQELIGELRAELDGALARVLERQGELATGQESLGSGLDGLKRISGELRQAVESSAFQSDAIEQGLGTQIRSLDSRVEQSLGALGSEVAGSIAELSDRQGLIAEAAGAASVDFEHRLGLQIAARDEALTASLARLTEEISAVRSELGAASTEQSARIADSAAAMGSDIERSQSDQSEALRQIGTELGASQARAAEQLATQVTELMDSVPGRLAADIAAVLEESRSRHQRVETLVAELAWVLGEQRAGNSGLRDELARALEELPAAINGVNEAALRSEARVTDLLARIAPRKLAGPDAR